MYLVFSARMRGESYLRLSCWTYVTYFERLLTPLFVDSARALWASFCFRSVTYIIYICVCVCVYAFSVTFTFLFFLFFSTLTFKTVL